MRIKVVHTFLLAGMPLNKLPAFREFLEEHACRLSDRRHMSDLVPFILTQEKGKIKEEIAGKLVSIIFDGTGKIGEVFVIVARFLDSEWCIQQRMIRLHILIASISKEEIACQVINTLALEYSIQSEQIVAIMHGCASANIVAIRILKVMYPFMLGIGCFLHTLNHVGERFNAPHVLDFMKYWISLFPQF